MPEAADDSSAFPTASDIDDVLAEFGGDHRAAIGALLHDLAILAGDFESWTPPNTSRFLA